MSTSTLFKDLDALGSNLVLWPNLQTLIPLEYANWALRTMFSSISLPFSVLSTYTWIIDAPFWNATSHIPINALSLSSGTNIYTQLIPYRYRHVYKHKITPNLLINHIHYVLKHHWQINANKPLHSSNIHMFTIPK